MSYIALMLLILTAAVLISGNAWVIDGDSIRINKTEFRLEGIDAPEHRQTCLNAQEKEYPCGKVSKNNLIKLVKGKKVSCLPSGKDKYGRWLATCFTGKTNINREQVLSGNALAYKRYSREYEGDETEAKTAKRGIWQGSFTRPEKWRILNHK